MIPKIIHQIWIGDADYTTKYEASWYDSWKKLNPTWELRFWNESEIIKFFESKYPWFIDRYNEFPHVVQKADAFRYFALYEYGGLYVDLDFECFKNIDELLDLNHGLMLSREHDHLKNSHSLLWRCVTNSLMFSKPKHKFWESIFDRIMAEENLARCVLGTTGPMMLTETLEKTGVIDDLYLMPSHWFYPYTWKHYKHISGKRKVKRILKEATKTTKDDWPDSYGVHRWAEVW